MIDYELKNEYWKNLKKYYEEDYNGQMTGKVGTDYAKEMEDANASFLDYDKPYLPNEVKTWIEETEEQTADDYQNEEEIFGKNPGEGQSDLDREFPNLWNYKDYYEEIASYFLHKDLDRFRDKISKGDKEYIEEAVRLDWTEMLENSPDVREMFLF